MPAVERAAAFFDTESRDSFVSFGGVLFNVFFATVSTSPAPERPLFACVPCAAEVSACLSCFVPLRITRPNPESEDCAISPSCNPARVLREPPRISPDPF
jgi:hypothetical protein